MKVVWLLGGYNDNGIVCMKLWKTQAVLRQVITKRYLKWVREMPAEENSVIKTLYCSLYCFPLFFKMQILVSVLYMMWYCWAWDGCYISGIKLCLNTDHVFLMQPL